MKKLIKKFQKFDSDIESEGLNLSERICSYGGLFAGAVTPIIVIRYNIPKGFGSEGILQEATLLGLSAVVSLPFSVYGTLAGGCFGSYTANKIKDRRIKKERNLGQVIDLKPQSL